MYLLAPLRVVPWLQDFACAMPADNGAPWCHLLRVQADVQQRKAAKERKDANKAKSVVVQKVRAHKGRGGGWSSTHI